MRLAVTLGLALVVIGPAPAKAVDVNRPAPDCRLPSTNGGEIPSGTSGARSGSSSSSTAPTSPSPERSLSARMGFERREVLAGILLTMGVRGGRDLGAHPARLVKIGALTESWGPSTTIVGLRHGLRERG